MNRTISMSDMTITHPFSRARLQQAHRLSAIVIACFVMAHIFNHLCAIRSIDSHLRVMQVLRSVYRYEAVESILWALVLFQATSGLYFVYGRGRNKRYGFDRLQALSGTYLAVFLFIHLAAIAYGRLALKLDTNFYYAAAGIHATPHYLFFVPYYFLAVVAVFAHVACALRWSLRDRLQIGRRDALAFTLIALGIIVGALIVASFAGLFHAVVVPQVYRATYA